MSDFCAQVLDAKQQGYAQRQGQANESQYTADSDNRDRFLELLLTLAERSNSSVVFVSHDQSLARHFHHRMALEVAP